VKVAGVWYLKVPMFFSLSYGRQAVKEVERLEERDGPFDLVHLHYPMMALFRSGLRRLSPPIVASMHGTWLGERRGLVSSEKLGVNPNDLGILMTGPLFQRFEAWALEQADQIWSNSSRTTDELLEYAKFLDPGAPDRAGKLISKKTRDILYGIDVEQFRPEWRDKVWLAERFGHLTRGLTANSRVVLSVSRLVARKGLFTLLRAFRRLMEQDPRRHRDTYLVLVGEGFHQIHLERYANHHKLRNVVFCGKLSFEDLHRIYASADLVAFPSIYEGQGLVPLEAMASGTPAIMTRTGAAEEMVPQEAGRLVDVGDASQLAWAMDELLGLEEEERLKMGKYGREFVEREFDWKHIIVRMEKEYEKLLR
jgi:glycosyltransferase involved in cell wall biosynthesis